MARAAGAKPSMDPLGAQSRFAVLTGVNAAGSPSAFGALDGPNRLTTRDGIDYRSKRSAFITLVQAATKSSTNFAALSSCA